MDELLWIDAQKFIDLAIAVTAAVALGLVVVQAAYIILLTIVLGREKRSTEKQ